MFLSWWRRRKYLTGLEAGLAADRLKAVEGLAALGGAGAREALERTLRDLTFQAVQAAAARGLGRLGDRAAVAALARVLDPGFWSPGAEARARGQAGFGVGIDAARREQARSEGRVRVACAEALGALGGPEARRALEARAGDRDPAVAAAAARALAEPGH